MIWVYNKKKDIILWHTQTLHLWIRKPHLEQGTLHAVRHHLQKQLSYVKCQSSTVKRKIFTPIIYLIHKYIHKYLLFMSILSFKISVVILMYIINYLIQLWEFHIVIFKMTERDYAPLSSACVRGLCDKLYEKRKFAGVEIEK